ncbi:DIP1984 family protein [Deinococcus puniceus]|uniref:Septicolysin n=1 Tax=Deinococcus puniceus TaxID=1182568 RepID=A0A172TA95_9DEIO|nr:DIP1984 family protein [Deinococcus puniceus]ANE43940.1 hypothetical protein SU48_09315 [Deinococcus puniceus]
MKLAEALIERADLQKRAAQLTERITSNLQIQEGEEVSEDPRALIAEYMSVVEALEALLPRIHRTNLGTRLGLLPDAPSLTEALTERDMLDLRLRMLRLAADAASLKQQRYSNSELRTVAVIPARELQAQADALARQRRELETRIQQTNWLTELTD